DSSGAENADKCAWTFGGPYVSFSNGTRWKIQGNWSNFSYDNNLGNPNSSGQNGCVDGTNVPGPFTRKARIIARDRLCPALLFFQGGADQSSIPAFANAE